MPRPKGSKNKIKPTISTADFTSLIAEKSSGKEALVADIASLEECKPGCQVLERNNKQNIKYL